MISKLSGFISRSVACFAALTTLSFATTAALAQGNTAPNQPTDPDVVSFVDISKYMGLWYEIASIPQSFQGFCQYTTAEYQVMSTSEISVANKCRVGIVPISIFGKAAVVDTNTNAILEVTFNNVSRKGDYRIVELADDYSYALVTNAKRDSLFVLSRTNKIDDSLYTSLLQRASDIGIDVSKVRKTKQD
jgi:apolipoprotein D and lipocalin family protein